MPINEIEELKNSFVKDLLPIKIYLVGSFAEGKQNADSDIDFYIVVDDSRKDMLDLTTRAYRSIRHKRKRPVDIIVHTSERFESKKASPVSVDGEVARKGVLLYEA